MIQAYSATIEAVFFHSPLLRAVNLSIAVLLLALAAGVYWIAWRSLPETSGTINAPIGAKGAIVRDARGVPHITAASWQDALFLQGYATAQDRLWQMDALRRLAAGSLSEVIGRSMLESDQQARRWRLLRIAEAQEAALPPESRAVLAAYARGVNYYLETHRKRLPPEFALLNYDPRPWRVRDSLLVALEMFQTLTSTWREEINKFQMLEHGDAAKVNFLYPRRTGGEIQPGSNAWAISGAHSATGKPILANDPHLEWSIPGAWYLVHLEAPDLDVTGASLPGIPCVIVGHNRRIAWGVTNLGFDVQDLYMEQIDLQSGRYLFQGQPQQARLERDFIAVKGERPVESTTWVTRHGPIFLIDGNRNYSMRWIAAEEGALNFSVFFGLDRARNWEEFNSVLAAFPGPGLNFVYADGDGNIGYHAAGRLPIRKGCEPDVPMDGASGQCEWQGFIPYDDLPSVFNPPSGVIVSANQNPFPADYKFQVDGRFVPRYRAQEIRARLASHEKWEPAQMLEVQKDVYSAFGHFLAAQLIAAWDKHPGSDPGTRDAVGLLRPWNGQMEKGLPAPMVAALLFDQVRNAVADRAAPGHSQKYESSFMAPEIVERLVRERPPDWFADYDALLLKSAGGAVAEGQKLQGSKLARWDYGQYNRLTIQSPVIGQLPVIGKYFNVGPIAMSGWSTTIKQTTRRLGPSMRMVVDFSNLDRSLANVLTGESGHPLSRHYLDHWNAYYAGRSFPMQFEKVDAAQNLTVSPQ